MKDRGGISEVLSAQTWELGGGGLELTCVNLASPRGCVGERTSGRMDSGWPVQTSPSLESERKRSAERYPFREGRSDKGRCYDEVAPAGTCAIYCVDTALRYFVLGAGERREPLSRWQDEVAVSGQTNMMEHRNLRWMALRRLRVQLRWAGVDRCTCPRQSPC